MEENKLPRYEKLQQSDFENLVLDIIKINEGINSNVKAVKRYLEIIDNLEPEQCKVNHSTSSVRKGIWEQLAKLGYVVF